MSNTTPTTTNAVDRLSTLSAQRTARTDRLREATIALLAKLAPITEPGDTAELWSGWSLTRTSCCGFAQWTLKWPHADFLLSRDGEESEYGFGSCEAEDAERPQLVGFARQAGAFVREFIALQEKTIKALAEAEVLVDGAAAKLEGSTP